MIARCDSKPCSGSSCPCSKAGAECNDACHMGRLASNTLISLSFLEYILEFKLQPIQPTFFRPWDSVPCLNTAVGAKVKLLKPAEVREWP